MKRFFALLFSALFFLTSVSPAARAAAVFSDVSSGHPYFEAIQALHEKGVLEGYANNTFRPDQPVNRAEALKIILLGSDIFVPEIQPAAVFPDVPHDVWYAKYAAKAKNLSIVSGDDGTGFFRPGDTINLAEILKMLLNANSIQTRAPENHPYADVPPDAWFARYFDYAQTVGLLEAPENHANPGQLVNRGLMAGLMYRLSQKPQGEAYGQASYYGSEFHGRTTASGEVFDASKFTAAHRTYPFGTWLKVTNLENNQSVTVRVNDRGPYAGGDRIIDLSKAAFEAIAPLSRGVVRVAVRRTSEPAPVLPADSGEPVAPVDTGEVPAPTPAPEEPVAPAAAPVAPVAESCSEKADLKMFSADTFQHILLSGAFPSHIIVDEELIFRGSVDGNADSVTAFFVDSAGKQHPFSAPAADGSFEVRVRFPDRGEYQFGLLPGKEGSSLVVNVTALPYACLQEQENSALAPVQGLAASVTDGEATLAWQKGDYDLFQLSFIQDGQFRRILLRDTDHFTPTYGHFGSFAPGAVAVHLRGARLGAESPLAAPVLFWSPPAILPLSAVTHEEYVIEADQVKIERLPQPVKPGRVLKLGFKPAIPIRATAAIMLPDGTVEDVTLTSADSKPIQNKNGVQVFPPSDALIEFTYRPAQPGAHFIEINNDEGLAAVNIPVYPADAFPLLPNYLEQHERAVTDLGSDRGAIRQSFLELINRDRQAFSKNPVVLDESLTTLAQLRADDMAKNDYFSHWNAEGRDANHLRLDLAITQTLAENLAKDVSPAFAEYGFMRSAIHRRNVLDGGWTRLGLGAARAADGTYIFVQLFSQDPIDLSDIPGLRFKILETVNASRSAPLPLDTQLTDIAQQWSEQMAAQDFFDFTAPDSSSIFQLIETAGITSKVGTAIFGNTSFADALEQIQNNSAVQKTGWQFLGVGLAQDGAGILKVTLIYSE